MANKLKDIVAGNTRGINVVFTDTSGTAHDLTGADLGFTAVLSGSTTPLIEINNTDNPTQFILTDAENGQVRVVLSSANTTLDAGSYNFGVQAVLADNTVIEDIGTFKVKTQYVS